MKLFYDASHVMFTTDMACRLKDLKIQAYFNSCTLWFSTISYSPACRIWHLLHQKQKQGH